MRSSSRLVVIVVVVTMVTVYIASVVGGGLLGVTISNKIKDHEERVCEKLRKKGFKCRVVR